ncbi:MAG: DKNYY domain-containing protein [Hyphomicrobiales bacterium]|nr:DKNYY domain-containing protein [Hyphomicrobiales bacterium]
MSATYARDARTAYFRDRPLRKCNLQALQPIHKLLATDGERLFWTNTPLPLPPAPFDMTHVMAQILNDYEINRPAIVLHDGKRVVFMTDDEATWFAPDGADPTTFEILEPRWQLYQKDNAQVYYRGEPLAGADPASAEMLGRHVVHCKTGLWCGDIPLHERFEAEDLTSDKSATGPTSIDPQRFIWVRDDIYRDGTHVWDIQTRRRNNDAPAIKAVAKIAAPQSDCDAALHAAFRPLGEILFHIFDTWLPLEMGTNQLDEELDKALADGKRKNPVTPIPDYEMTRDGGTVTLSIAGAAIVEAPVSAWLTLLTGLWAHAAGRRDRLLLYPQTGYMLPDGDEMVIRIVRRLQDQMMDLASAFVAAGESGEADVIAHQVLYRAHKHHDLQPALVARSAPDLLGMAQYNERHHEFTQTTNLAAARQTIASGMLDDPDFRVRYEACRVLHGTTASTNQNAHFLKDILPAVSARLEQEPNGFLREMLHAIIECMLVRGFRNPDNTGIHELLAPFVELQIRNAVNADLNRGRWIVTLLAAGKDAEAAATQKELLASVAGHKAPPMYSDNMAYRSWELWLLANACEIASLQNAAGKLKPGRGDELRAERKRLFELCGKPKGWWEFEEIDRYFRS